MISDDEYLERVVAGIQAVTTSGADVTWNEIINERQFDVVVRFKLGLHRYLVLVEVKNRTRPAAASDLDAFVLKARDQNANKAIFVTAAGFQSGAINVARRHAVDLFTVRFDENEIALPHEMSFVRKTKPGSEKVPVVIELGELTLVAAIEKVTLRYKDGREMYLPSEASQMNYYMKRTRLAGETLLKIVSSHEIYDLEENQIISKCVEFEPPRIIDPPDQYFFKTGPVTAMEWLVIGRKRRPLQGNAFIEPNLFVSPVIYKNEITGEEFKFMPDQLPFNFEPISPGNFYCSAHREFYYYCESIENGMIKWSLIESFQGGNLVTSTYTQKVEYGFSYVPVTDKKAIQRLQGRLNDLRRRAGN